MLNNKDISKIIKYRNDTTTKSSTKKEEQKTSAPKATVNTTTPSVKASTPTSTKTTTSSSTKSTSSGTTKSSSINPNSPAGIKALYGKDVQKVSASQQIPSLEPDNKLIDYYESIPNYNAAQRLFDKDKRDAYKEKQSLSQSYQTEINKRNRQKFYDAGLTDEEARWYVSAPDPYEYDAVSGERLNPGSHPEYDKKNSEIVHKILDNGTETEFQNAFGDIIKEENAKAAVDDKVMSSVNSVVIKPFESAINVGKNAVQYLSGSPITATSYSDNIRQAVKEDNAKNGRWGGKVANTLYDATMAGGDMLMVMGLGGLFTGGGAATSEAAGKIANKISSATMGLEKAQGTINSAVERDLNPGQIATEGALSGVITYLTSAIPFDTLTSVMGGKITGKGVEYLFNLGKAVAKAGLPEGLQEMAEDFGDNLVDLVIAKDKSELASQVAYLKENGMSEKEAIEEVGKQFLKETLYDGLIGFLSGGGLGAAGSALNTSAENMIPTLEQNPNVNANAETNLQNAVEQELAEADQNVPNFDAMPEELLQTPVEDNVLNDKDILPLDLLNEETNANVNPDEQIVNENVPTMDNVENDLEVAYNTALDAIENDPINSKAIVEDAISTLLDNGNLDDAIALEDLYNETLAENLNNVQQNEVAQAENVNNIQPEQMPTMSEEYNTENDGNNNIEDITLNNPQESKATTTEKPTTDKFKTSEYVTNTIMNSPTFKQNENFAKAIEKGIDKGEFDVDVQTWKWQNQKAAENLAKDWDGTVKAIEDTPDIDGVQIKEGHMIADDLIKRESESGTFEGTRKWVKLLANKIHGAAQGLNAIKEFGRTASSALIKTEKMADIKTNGVKDSVKNKASQTAGKLVDNANVVEQTREGLHNFLMKLNLQFFGAIEDLSGNKRLNSILKKRKNQDVKATEKPAQKTFEEFRQEVADSFANSEYAEEFRDMPDEGIDFITALIMDKSIKREVITDELEHWLKHGTFYTIDESTETAKPTNKKLNSVLNSLWNDASVMRDSSTKAKSFDVVENEVLNTLAGEYGSVFGDMSKTDLDFLTTLLMDDTISRDTIGKELDYYAKNGKFYTIDESIENEQDSNARLDNIIRKMTDDGTMVKEPAKKTFDEVRAEVKKTIDKEGSNLFRNFNDAKIDFLTNMIMQGQSEEEITNALLRNYATGHFEVSDADIAKINEICEAINNHKNPESKEVVDLENQMFEILGKYLGPGTFAEKATQWRFLAMLFNPGTHGRNFVSNNLFGGVISNMKDIIASSLETIGRVDEKTKAPVFKRLSKNDNALYNKGFKDFETSVYRQAQGSKYSMEKGIYENRKVYKDKGLGKLLNKGIKVNKDFLEKSDVKSMQYRYARALSGYLKANGKNADIFSSRNESDIELLDKAREYALKEAKIATYHEENKAGQLLSRWSREGAESNSFGGNALHLAIESTMPFKSTPINIGKQGLIEYNPVTVVKDLIQTGNYLVHKAKGTEANLKYTPADIINNYAKRATGGAVMYLGWMLASMGLVRAGSDDDEADKFAGLKRYSLVLPNGGTYTLDWLAPACIPLFLGVELYEQTRGDGNMLDALGGMTDIMLEMTFLQGLSNAFKSAGYATDSKQKIANFGISVAGNYASQFLPTAGNKLARVIDPYQRNTYVTGEKNGSIKEAVKKQGRYLMNKVPGLSMLNEKSYDALGEEKKNVGKNFLDRLLYNTLSLGNYGAPIDKNDTVRQELYRLGKIGAADEHDDIPSVIPESFPKTYGGEPLSPKQYAELTEKYGKSVKDSLGLLFDTSEYQELSDKDKAIVVDKLNGFNFAMAKSELGYNMENSTNYSKYWKEYQRNNDMNDVIDMMIKDTVYNDVAKQSNLGKNTNLFKDIQAQNLTQQDVNKIVGITPEQTAASQAKIQEELPTLDYNRILNPNGYVDKWTSVPYLHDELGLSSAERGEILYNTGTRGQKEIDAFNKWGYDGVATYYDTNYYGDTKFGDGNQSLKKKEAIAYLESQGYDAATINAWLEIFTWQPDYAG